MMICGKQKQDIYCIRGIINDKIMFYFKEISSKHSAIDEIANKMNMGHFLPMLCIRGVLIQKGFLFKK